MFCELLLQIFKRLKFLKLKSIYNVIIERQSMIPDNINGPQNNNMPNNVPAENAAPKTVKPKRSIFDAIFKGEDRQIADKNQDGSISLEEAYNYIGMSGKDTGMRNMILDRLGAFLGIENNSGLDSDKDAMYKYQLQKSINVLLKVDTNADSDVTIDEIRAAKNLTDTEKKLLNTAFGLVDGNIDNKQGSYGSCWALTAGYGLSKEAPDLYQKVVKQDEEGNAIVTFYGLGDEPVEFKVSREYIHRMIVKRTAIVNHNNNKANMYGNGEQNLSNYGSSDPDAIALEAAMSMYDKKIKQEEEAYRQQLVDYVNSSTPNIIEKPDISKLAPGMSQEDWKEFFNYYKNSESEYKNQFLFTSLIDEMTPDDIENMRTYVANSTPAEVVKPDVNKLSLSSKLFNYIKNSHSDTMEKPEWKLIGNRIGGTITGGGDPGRGVQALAGGTCEKYYGYHYEDEYTELTNEELAKIEQILKDKQPGDKKIYSTSFKSDDKTVISSHAYFISRVEGNKVYLVDPHDSSREISYPLKKFLGNFSDLAVNTLPA